MPAQSGPALTIEIVVPPAGGQPHLDPPEAWLELGVDVGREAELLEQ